MYLPADLLIWSQDRKHGKLTHVVFQESVKLFWKYYPWKKILKKDIKDYCVCKWEEDQDNARS